MALLTVVASSTTAAQAVATNFGRGGLVVANTDANRAYVLLGPGTASATNFSFSLAENADAFVPNCSDRVSVVWAADGTGNLMVTEYDR